jgi:DNA polymerase III epsilon subunit-like protein
VGTRWAGCENPSRGSDEYVILVNPQRDVGAAYIHGVAQQDVDAAPTSDEISGDVLACLAGLILVGHNVRYDLDFLGAELSAAGLFLPAVPSLRTLKLGYRPHPTLANHKLATCCAAAGLPQAGVHEAYEDASSTAQLLSVYIREAQTAGMTMQDLLGGEVVFRRSGPRCRAASGRRKGDRSDTDRGALPRPRRGQHRERPSR